MNKNNCLFILFLSIFSLLSAQPEDKETERGLRDSILTSIQKNRDSANNEVAQKIGLLEQKMALLDKQLSTGTLSNEDRIKALEAKVYAVELIQTTGTQSELNNYQANYQSAIINLVAMERELKPLYLFRSSQDFYSTLNEVCSPMNYPGYSQWFAQFKAYVEKGKSKEATLAVVSNMLSVAGNLAQGTPLSGPLAQTLFVGIGNFIGTLGTNQKQLRDQSEKMFKVTMVLSQFNHDKSLIENEWESINKELQDLQQLYSQTLQNNLIILKVDSMELKKNFTKENDANKRFVYLNELTNRISDCVAKEKVSNPKKWKEKFYYEMQTVQSLKMRFGQITFRISQNLGQYKELISKYKDNPEIGAKVSSLEIKLNNLRESFDSAFDPLEYIKAADRMYHVE